MSKNHFSARDFLSMTPEKQMQELGIRLYPKVCEKYPENIAKKVTGMLLQMEPMEVMNLLENPDAFEEMTNEAYALARK
jgi:polyadenylate-binding protein